MANPFSAHKPTLNASISDKVLRIVRCELMLAVFYACGQTARL